MTHAPPGTGSLVERIHHAYGDLTDSERKAADFILQSPGDIAMLAANELAERSLVSNATVSRLCQRIGYRNYDEARRAARELRASGGLFHLFDSTAAEPPPQHEIMARQLAEETSVLELSLSMINPETIRQISTRLAEAQRLWCVGFRNSRILADYARAIFSAFRPDVHTLVHAGHSLAEAAVAVRSSDIVLAYGLRRRMAVFAPLLHALRDRGADVVLVTDRSMKSSANPATWTLISAIETSQPIDSFSGPLAITRLLALETLRQVGPDARRMLREVDEVQVGLGELE